MNCIKCNNKLNCTHLFVRHIAHIMGYYKRECLKCNTFTYYVELMNTRFYTHKDYNKFVFKLIKYIELNGYYLKYGSMLYNKTNATYIFDNLPKEFKTLEIELILKLI